MSAFTKSKSSHMRSISLPCRSHPTTVRIEEELNKFKTIVVQVQETPSASDSVCNGLSRLGELYKCLDDLLNLSQTVQALSKHQNEKWVDEFLDKSLRVLDICGITKEIVSQSKENVRDLQSSLRRRRNKKGDSSVSNIEISITKYTSFRKQMKKHVKRSIAEMKQIDQEIVSSTSSSSILDVDQHVSALIRVLREVNSTSISIFQSTLFFLLANPQSSRTNNKWSLVSRLLMHKGTVACEDHHKESLLNEFESVDAALRTLICKNDQIQNVQNKLQNLEAGIENVENELEAMFRCLIRSRTSLLNVFSS